MFPLPSTTISFQPKLEIPLRSACRTIDPSGSLRSSSLPVTSRRPSGNQSMDQPRPAGPWPVTRAVAVQIDRDDLARSPVGEPQPALMPARRFHIGESVQQDFGFRHGRCVFFGSSLLFSKVDLRFFPFMRFPCLASVRGPVRGLSSFPANHGPFCFSCGRPTFLCQRSLLLASGVRFEPEDALTWGERTHSSTVRTFHQADATFGKSFEIEGNQL